MYLKEYIPGFTILLTIASFIMINICMSEASNTERHYNPTSNSIQETATNDWWVPEFTIIRKVYEDCQDKNDFILCLKERAMHALSRALEQNTIKIADGLVLEKQNQTDNESILNSLTNARMFNNLTPLDRSLLEKLDKLTRTHALKMDMSSGRGHHEKKKKKRKRWWTY